MQVVAERGKYFYGYTDYLVSSLLRTFCGCCCSKNSDSWYSRRVQKLERHEVASERLANEIDIVKLLYLQRVGAFMAKLILKKHQRALVSNFKKYQLESFAHADPKSKTPGKVSGEDSKLLGGIP